MKRFKAYIAVTVVLAFATLAHAGWMSETRDMLFEGLVRFRKAVNFESTATETHSGTETHAGTETHTGAVTNSGAVTINNDLTVGNASDGGNGYGGNFIQGKLKFGMAALGLGTNGAAAGKTLALMDDSPAGEWTASDADVVCSNNTTYYKAGSNSLKMAFTTAADTGDGCHDGVTYDFSADESVGFWIRSSVALAAGDVVLDITDDGGSHKFDVPALSAGAWTWVELAMSETDGEKDVITDLSLELSAAGATKAASAAFDVYVDGAYKWDSTEEEELGDGLVLDGIYGILAFVDDGTTGADTAAELVMYTDYFVNYTDSNEQVVWITDQSAHNNVAFFAYSAGP